MSKYLNVQQQHWLNAHLAAFSMKIGRYILRFHAPGEINPPVLCEVLGTSARLEAALLTFSISAQ